MDRYYQFNLGVIETEITEIVTEIEVIVVTVTTEIVNMKEIVIEMKSADIARGLTRVPGLHLRAVADEMIVKRRRRREDVQEAD